MKKCARILRLLLNAYRSELEIIYLRNYMSKNISIKYRYARVSTDDQKVDLQIAAMKNDKLSE